MGPAAQVSEYFASIGFEMPRQINPADYIIDVLLDPDRAHFTTTDITKLDFASSFRESNLGAEVAAQIQVAKTNYPDLSGFGEAKMYATGMLKQFKELGLRHWRTQIRKPTATLVSLVQAVMLSFVIGSIFYQLGYIAPAAIQGRVGVLFFIMINGAFGLSQATGAFIEERLLVNRERASGMYSAGPYFWSRVMIDTPLQLLQIILFSTIMYWMAQLNGSAERFFLYFAIVIVNALVASAIFGLIGSVAPTPTVGNILVPVVTVLFFLFAGFFISPAQIPDWWVWVYWISWFRYVYPALMINEFLGSNFTCAPGAACGALTGEQILTAYAVPVDYDWIWQCILICVGWAILYRLMTYLVIVFLQKEKR